MPCKKPIKVRVAQPERPVAFKKFQPWMIDVAARMAKAGETDRAISIILGIHYSTFRDWVSKNEKLRAALLRSKAVADARVEMSLYENALGFDYYEEEVKVIEGQIVKVEVRRHAKGETAAQINWLANRTDWRRNPDTMDMAPTPVVGPDKPIDITPENARQMARKVALVLFKGGKVA